MDEAAAARAESYDVGNTLATALLRACGLPTERVTSVVFEAGRNALPRITVTRYLDGVDLDELETKTYGVCLVGDSVEATV